MERTCLPEAPPLSTGAAALDPALGGRIVIRKGSAGSVNMSLLIYYVCIE